MKSRNEKSPYRGQARRNKLLVSWDHPSLLRPSRAHCSLLAMRCTMRWLVGGIRPMQRSTILSSTIRWEWLTPKFRPTLEFGRPWRIGETERCGRA
jgi:hypothetical protein